MMEMAFCGQLWTQARQFSHSPSATEWPSTTFQEPCGHTEVQTPHPTQASVEKTINDFFGTGDRRPLTVTPGGTVIPLADHPVHLGDRKDIILALVNGGEDGCDFLGNQLILRVRHFPGRVKIRQVGIDHLDRIDVIHLETVLLGQIVHELREDRAMGAESADGEEIIGLERGTLSSVPSSPAICRET